MARRGWKFGPAMAMACGPMEIGVGGRGRFFESGEVRLAILSLLSEGPRHGYQLMKDLEERSGGMYRASAGTVYPTLQLLEDEELVEVERANGKRVYRITEAGQAELDRNEERVKRIWDRAERWEDWGQWMGPETFAVAGSIKSVVKAILRAAKRAGDDPEQQERIRKIIGRATRDLEKLEGAAV